MVRLSIVALMLFVMLAALPATVTAADFSWNTGTAVEINLKTNPAPSWLQLFSMGVKITDEAKICHPFDRGLNDWIGEIYQLKDGQWSKLPTTLAWVPNKEGHYTACAQAPSAGTYALFGYYKNPATPTAPPVIDLSGDWNTGKEVAINLKNNPAPESVQLFTMGVEAPKKTQICHPFSYALYGWTAAFYQLKDGKWVKQPAPTLGWIPSKEGHYSACMTTTEAGTYALFGYFK